MKNEVFDTALFIYVGIPGSGKSTRAKEMMKQWPNELVWLSSDNIRIEHDYEISNKEVFNIMWNRVKDNALNKKYIIYDATNLRSKNRVHLIKQYKSFCQKNNLTYSIKAVIFLQPIDVCIKRNCNRSGREYVPEDVIWRMAKQFQFPMMWEGFNGIVISECSKGEFLSIEEICMMPQDNPYHTMSLGEHLCVTQSRAISANYSNEVCGAALYHDIGKWYCKEFDDSGIAHYYGHENVGAYALALHFLIHGVLTKSKYYQIVCLVNYHMRPYAWENSDRARSADKKKFGKEFYERLRHLHFCDIYAH